MAFKKGDQVRSKSRPDLGPMMVVDGSDWTGIVTVSLSDGDMDDADEKDLIMVNQDVLSRAQEALEAVHAARSNIERWNYPMPIGISEALLKAEELVGAIIEEENNRVES